jgi:hypothetical protein
MKISSYSSQQKGNSPLKLTDVFGEQKQQERDNRSPQFKSRRKRWWKNRGVADN